MPCNCDHMEPSEHERESYRVLSYLREIGLPTGKYDRNYGRVKTIHEDTATLCEWCQHHPDEVTTKSLELQIWWRDHQAADRKKEEQAKAEAEHKALVQQAKAKLTPEELAAIRRG